MAKTKTIRAVFEKEPGSEWTVMRCHQCERTTGYKCVTRRFTINKKQEWIRYLCWDHMAQWAKRVKSPIQNIRFAKNKRKIIVAYIEKSRWMKVW